MRGRIRCTFASAAILVLTAWAAPLVQAQALSRFDLPAQPLADSIRAIGGQTNINVLFDPPLVAGHRAPALKARLTTDEAFSRLLAGTGIQHEFLNEKTIVLARASEVAAKPGKGSAAEGADKEPAPTEGVEEVVVTAKYAATSSNVAGKMDIPLIETPQSISVITREQIESLHWQDVAQAMRYSSGAAGDLYGPDVRYDFTTIRGFNVFGSFLDGLRLPVGGGFAATSRPDVTAAESIEVLKGPSSTLYGATSPGGLTNVTSRRPRPERTGSLTFATGSHDHYEGVVHSTGALNRDGTLYYDLTGRYLDNRTQVDFATEQRTMAAPALTWQPSERLTLTLLTRYQRDRNKGSVYQSLPRYGTAAPNPNGAIPTSRYVGDLDFDVFDRDEIHAGYFLDYRLAGAVSLHHALRYSSIDVVARSTGPDTYSGDHGFEPDYRTLYRTTFTADEDVRGIVSDTRLRADFSTGALAHKLLVGLDYQRTAGRFAAGFGAAPSIDVFAPVYRQDIERPPLYADQKTPLEQTGVYLQDQAKWKRWIVTVGGRHDWIDTEVRDFLFGADRSQRDSAFSGRLGLNYVFDSGLAPYAAVSSSFEPAIGVDRLGNVFEPVRGEQAEIGIKYQPAGQNSLMTLAVYELTQENVLTTDPADPLFAVQTGEARARGVEIEAVGRVNEAFSFNLSFAYNDTEITRSNAGDLGQPLPNAPQRQAALFASYVLRDTALRGLGFGGGVRFRDEVLGVPTTSSATLVDASVHYTSGPWNTAFSANNLFDVRHVTSCYEFGCTFGDRRSIYATVSYRWGSQ